MRDKSKKSLSDVAYNALKKRVIATGGGTYISAREFAREVGLSYTPVREAFLRMEKEGSLKLVPNVGFFVNSLDVSEVIQIFQARECTELFVLDKVFDHITPEHIAQMKKVGEQLSEALVQKNIYEYQQLDIKLHEIIFMIYGNRHLLLFYKNVREQYMICSMKIAKQLSNDAIMEHNEYIDSIESGNKELALNQLRKHLQQARDRMVEGYINVFSES